LASELAFGGRRDRNLVPASEAADDSLSFAAGDAASMVERRNAFPWSRQRGMDEERRDFVRNHVLSQPSARAQLFAGLRRTHSRILADLPEDGHTIIAVCSALPGEGKTTVAAALAEMLSEDFGRQTLLIDGDLQNGMLAALMNVETAPGVKECLNSNQLLTESIRWTGSCWLMQAGTAQLQPDSLSLDNQRNLLRTLRSLFRVTVIDLPAIADGPQSVVLSLLANSVLWVARADAAPVDMVADAMDMVGRDRILGVVLNGEHSSLPGWLRRMV
jgi:succinoglycan biosynthesis transport protein ExoP